MIFHGTSSDNSTLGLAHFEMQIDILRKCLKQIFEEKFEKWAF